MVDLAVWCDWLWLALGWTTWAVGPKIDSFCKFLYQFWAQKFKKSNQIFKWKSK